jgi:hypothetical protein
MSDYYSTQEAVVTTESDSSPDQSPDQLGGFLGKSDAWLVDNEVTIATAEASFLAGPWSSESPWETSDEWTDRATRGPKTIVRMGSTHSTPAGIPCC